MQVLEEIKQDPPKSRRAASLRKAIAGMFVVKAHCEPGVRESFQKVAYKEAAAA